MTGKNWQQRVRLSGPAEELYEVRAAAHDLAQQGKLARGNGSTFQGTLPIAKKYKVAAINWGFVAGKTQTTLPWDSWKTPYVDREPPAWFHDIFMKDGTPYKPEEVAFIREMTGAGAKGKKGKAARK